MRDQKGNMEKFLANKIYAGTLDCSVTEAETVVKEVGKLKLMERKMRKSTRECISFRWTTSQVNVVYNAKRL